MYSDETSVLTLAAGMNEYYSGFDNIGHNTIIDLIPLWIIPKYAPPSTPCRAYRHVAD